MREQNYMFPITISSRSLWNFQTHPLALCFIHCERRRVQPPQRKSWKSSAIRAAQFQEWLRWSIPESVQLQCSAWSSGHSELQGKVQWNRCIGYFALNTQTVFYSSQSKDFSEPGLLCLLSVTLNRCSFQTLFLFSSWT